MNKESNSSSEFNEYLASIHQLIEFNSNFQIQSREYYHGVIVLAEIFKHSKSEVRILAGSFKGVIADNSILIESIDNYLSRGGKLQVLLTHLDFDNSKLLKLISQYQSAEVKELSKEKVGDLQKEFNGKLYHFTVGDNQMYRLEINPKSFYSVCNFNDPQICSRLIRVFDDAYVSNASHDIIISEIYKDLDFEKTCSIIIPDFNNINLELLEYFSKNPENIERMKWRKFEMLLDYIFKNQGYETQLGAGWNDGGIDLRLVQKDSIGQILTFVQAKKYKKGNPIKLDAVQALTAVVNSHNANRGLFVTTSTFLPSVQKWVDQQPTKIILANSIDVANWCKQVTNILKT